MNIHEVLELDHPFCAPADTLQQAAERMCLWQSDALPVCDADRRWLGSITSRDICQKACVTGAPLGELRVESALREDGCAGRIDDDVEQVLGLMVRQRVWQLPVIDAEQRLVGMVCYQKLLRSISGARDVMVIVPEAGQLDEVMGVYEYVPTWTLVTRHRELIAPDGTSTQLSGAEAKLLLALAENGGRVVDREALTRIVLHRAWDPTDRYVDVVVANLRRKFGERASDARAIRTVPNEGYVLTLKVADERRLAGDPSLIGDSPLPHPQNGVWWEERDSAWERKPRACITSPAP